MAHSLALVSDGTLARDVHWLSTVSSGNPRNVHCSPLILFKLPIMSGCLQLLLIRDMSDIENDTLQSESVISAGFEYNYPNPDLSPFIMF